MAETEENQETAEKPEADDGEKDAYEREREENESAGQESRAELGEVVGKVEGEVQPLQEGQAIDSPIGELHTRSLVAMGLVVAIFVVLYFIFWQVFGSWGVAVGWIPAAALGLLAAREYSRRKASS